MITRIWAISQKTFILFFLSAVIIFAKVEKIDDEFDGTYYYQTDSAFIRDYKAYQMLEYRFRTTKVKDNHRIIIELNVVGDASTFSVSTDDRVYIKCSDGHIITLEYQSVFSFSDNGFSYMGNVPQSIRSIAIFNDKDTEAILGGIDMIKVETDKGYKNLNIKPKDSNTMVKKLNEIIKKIEEDKK